MAARDVSCYLDSIHWDLAGLFPLRRLGDVDVSVRVNVLSRGRFYTWDPCINYPRERAGYPDQGG